MSFLSNRSETNRTRTHRLQGGLTLKVLVTGGAGFIGTHLVNRLTSEGHHVIVIDKKMKKKEMNPLITYYNIHIQDESISSIFAKERPSVIFHFAAQTSVSNSMNNPYEDAENNILGTLQLLKNATTYNVQKFIFASSAAIYGSPQHLPIREHHPIQPTSFYGLSKAVGEQYIAIFSSLYHIDYTILRFSNVYGPGQCFHGETNIITKLMESFHTTSPLVIFGDGTQTRDFIYVHDVINACLQALYCFESRTLNISSNTETSINQLINILSRLTARALPFQYGPQKQGDIWHSRLQNEKARQFLHWKPEFSIKQGLIETLQQITMN